MGTFDSLQIPLSSLFAQRRAIDVTGQNIANANTEGYSRQRVVMKSIGGNTVPAIFSTAAGGSGGVEVSDVARMRDVFMDLRGRDAHAGVARATVMKDTLGQIEGIINEPSDSGLSSALTDLWAGFDDVANNPGDLAARSQLLQRASSVSDWLNASSNALSQQWSDDLTQLNALVAEANSAASGIAELNDAIKRASIGGLPSNELADQRDQLAMKLAELIGATTRAGADGSVDVLVGGTAMVRGNIVEPLTTTGPLSLSVPPTGSVGLAWVDDGLPVSNLGGKAAGYADVLNTTLPTYAGKLDEVAANLASKVNGQLAAGYDLRTPPSTAPLFAGTTAGTISVAITDPTWIAASATPGTLDGSNADALAALARDNTGPDALYRQRVVGLGVESQSAIRRVDVLTGVAADLDDARDAASGVNIDEEMVNLLSFQRAYEGASRMLTAVDQMLDTLINRTGMAGR